MSILQELYDLEINASIEWFWDNGFEITLGDAMNGYCDETCVRTWEEAEQWLREKAAYHYPHAAKELIGTIAC